MACRRRGVLPSRLIETVIFLLLLLLAFGAITVIAAIAGSRSAGSNRFSLVWPRPSWWPRSELAAESPRSQPLAGECIFNTNLTVSASRGQALLGIGLALAVTVVGIIRIETYHRRLVSPSAPEEDADWKVEPPEIAGRR